MCDYTLTVCAKERTTQSERAIANLRRIFSNGLVERCRLEIVDGPEAPQPAEHARTPRAPDLETRRSGEAQ